MICKNNFFSFPLVVCLAMAAQDLSAYDSDDEEPATAVAAAQAEPAAAAASSAPEAFAVSEELREASLHVLGAEKAEVVLGNPRMFFPASGSYEPHLGVLNAFSLGHLKVLAQNPHRFFPANFYHPYNKPPAPSIEDFVISLEVFYDRPYSWLVFENDSASYGRVIAEFPEPALDALVTSIDDAFEAQISMSRCIGVLKVLKDWEPQDIRDFMPVLKRHLFEENARFLEVRMRFLEHSSFAEDKMELVRRHADLFFMPNAEGGNLVDKFTAAQLERIAEMQDRVLFFPSELYIHFLEEPADHPYSAVLCYDFNESRRVEQWDGGRYSHALEALGPEGREAVVESAPALFADHPWGCTYTRRLEALQTIDPAQIARIALYMPRLFPCTADYFIDIGAFCVLLVEDAPTQMRAWLTENHGANFDEEAVPEEVEENALLPVLASLSDEWLDFVMAHHNEFFLSSLVSPDAEGLQIVASFAHIDFAHAQDILEAAIRVANPLLQVVQNLELELVPEEVDPRQDG